MTPSTQVEKAKGRRVEKNDASTPRRHAERAVTIQDVALRARVSISTVSRVVTGSVAVEPATAERVREAIASLGYRPNLLARSFRRRVTHTIGLLVPDTSNPFFAEVARAAEDAGFAEGYSVVLCNSDLSPVKQETYIDVLLAKRVDGFILVSSGLIPGNDGDDAVERILEAECRAWSWTGTSGKCRSTR
jgi:LacI family transcriptional regulator